MTKAKISVTVDRALLDACDRLSRGVSRSELVETALARWLRDHRQQRLQEEVEQYYASLDPAERGEDERWSEASARTLGETWK